MDDIWGFFCGTVPILFWHGPRPRPWLTLLAAGLGGVLGLVVFGPKFASDGGAISTFLVSAVGGAFVAQVVEIGMNMVGANRT